MQTDFVEHKVEYQCFNLLRFCAICPSNLFEYSVNMFHFFGQQTKNSSHPYHHTGSLHNSSAQNAQIQQYQQKAQMH
jgi:hypothetical protein